MIRIRENLSSKISNEQFAIDTFESHSPLHEKDQMASGNVFKELQHQNYTITNEKLLDKFRWCEFLKVLSQIRVEFSDSYEISRLFQQMGVDTRSGDVWEMYLEQEDLLCNYCFQVNLDPDAPVFMKVLAFVKGPVKGKRHRH